MSKILRQSSSPRVWAGALLVVLAACLPAHAQDSAGKAPALAFDLAILNGHVVDGTGAPWYEADVGISDGKIAHIGRIDPASAKHTIDAEGLIVAPGFIDMMGQTATPMLRNPSSAMNLLTQGITTINAGEGSSAAPLSSQDAKSTGWQNMAEYFQLLDLKGMPVNTVQTIGHTQVRRLVMGEDNRRPSEDELEAMKEHVREAMRAGAIGVSTALIYPPAVYASTEEIGALAGVAGEHGGRYYTHMRNEGDQLLEAIDEALEIGRVGNTPVHIFHLKAAGRQNWGKMQLAIARIKAARSEGHPVTADIYPYINNGLGIDALIHPRHFGEGRAKFLHRLANDADLRAEVREEIESTSGWENWFRHAGSDWNRIIVGQTTEPHYREYAGQSVAAIAKATGEDAWDTFFGLCNASTFALPETMSDANKILAMQQEFVSFCTDVGPAGGNRGASHPRSYGAFPRMLSRYVRDLGAISLEQAISQASAAAANNVMVHDRGRIAEGLAADVIVFDFDELADRADFENPHAESVGMKHVIVNGVAVLADGKFTGKRPGQVLRGPGFDAATASHAIITGEDQPAFREIDAVMQSFLREHRIPGASLAITDHGNLVYARGFGYADVGQRQPVTPESLFRIASISKPITAVAILQLIDQGKLSLDDKVFEVLDHEAHIEEGSQIDERQNEITIQHLLQHRGGWDRDQSFDAMFRSTQFAKALGVAAPATPDTIIRVMRGKSLDFDPGERYAYSNYGYCLLGRVIEQISGETYEDYVQQHVLEPIGVTSMSIGATRLEGRKENEVRYYDPRQGDSVFAQDLNSRVPQPYGAWHLEAMDSHGAWIASASDLVRFASAFDNPDNSLLLTSSRITEMFARPEGLAGHDQDGQPKATYYGLGWSVTTDDSGRMKTSHSGSLPGTNTILVRRPDGRNVALLFNTRVTARLSRVTGAVLPQIMQAIDQIDDWPQPNSN
ncbi:serine hydrolase [Rhodopirellula sp. P2]|uniref:serine hydrolase n=1 Tax=Rhodopirellula sp. P2 TaxID=2127060 RepID=UPI0023685606|nr:serine hydrolase [Rhodopirellula sp. P2]WDQ15781.1 serine hydrolase [Rhodopirellula sp. P2]